MVGRKTSRSAGDDRGVTSSGKASSNILTKREDAVKVEVWNDISPSPGSRGYGTVIRALRTPFIDTWQHRRDDARREADRLRGEVLAALQQGRIHELLPFA